MLTESKNREEFVIHAHTDFLVSSKKIFALSGIPSICCDIVPAPLIPDVAFVEFPPIKL